MITDALTNRRCVITGASRGLGLEIARLFLAQGARLLLCARNLPILDESATRLRSQFPQAEIHTAAADVAVTADLDRLADTAQQVLGGVDALVSNAGIHGPLGPLQKTDWDYWLHTVQVNLGGSAYAIRAFLPLLQQSERGKIVLLSGGGATKSRPFVTAYAVSKTAIVRLAETLADEFRQQELRIDINAVAPGAMNTALLREIIDAGPQVVGQQNYDEAVKVVQSTPDPESDKTAAKAAACCAFLASRSSDGITGKLISAVWDPWSEFPQLIDHLKRTDVYTLRRIVPEERGLPSK